ncbi:MAG: hypothetical protein GY804_09530 [Alphaproteobacteria bacterium]|nr:hypothetical protein [Alphaproteobacteria bacterium]
MQNQLRKKQKEFSVDPLSILSRTRRFDCNVLVEYLQKHNYRSSQLDSYSLSPAYYAMTGRKGVRIYSDTDTAIVYCKHPNVENKVLIFPEIGKGGLLNDLIEEMPLPKNGIQLARVPKTQTEGLIKELSVKFSSDITFKEVPEYAQDWLYPVHVLSTKLVSELKGGDFRNPRRRFNKINREHTIRLDARKKLRKSDVFLVNDFVKRWSDNFNGTKEELESWLSYVHFMIDLYEKKQHGLGCAMVHCDDNNIQSLSFFEKPIVKGQPANYLASLYNREIKGISEFSHWFVCKNLYDMGIDKVNIGGSESEGLDVFKRKFNPIESKHLSTIEVVKKY